MKSPPVDLVQRLLAVSERVLDGDPPLRLEDVAGLVGASRATLYYYFSGRDDLVVFLLGTHARLGAQAVDAVVKADDPPEQRLRESVVALATFLGRHPGVCAGLLGALGTSRMTEAVQANDAWIGDPLRVLLAECGTAGVVNVDDVAVAANAMLGALLLAVLGRSSVGADPTDARFRQQLTDQVLRGVLTLEVRG